jgi:hypothetical protein
MIKQTITYTDFNDVEHTEDFWFHISKAELAEKQVSSNGLFAQDLQEMVNRRDNSEMMNTFKELILLGYGIRSEDGMRFKKSKDISENFSETAAYSELFIYLLEDPERALTFFTMMLPNFPDKEIKVESAKRQLIEQMNSVDTSSDSDNK